MKLQRLSGLWQLNVCLLVGITLLALFVDGNGCIAGLNETASMVPMIGP